MSPIAQSEDYAGHSARGTDERKRPPDEVQTRPRVRALGVSTDRRCPHEREEELSPARTRSHRSPPIVSPCGSIADFTRAQRPPVGRWLRGARPPSREAGRARTPTSARAPARQTIREVPLDPS